VKTDIDGAVEMGKKERSSHPGKHKAVIWLAAGFGSGIAIGAAVGVTLWTPMAGIALGIALGAGLGGVPASLYYFGDLK
jgi:uncharacterized membrane protein